MEGMIHVAALFLCRIFKYTVRGMKLDVPVLNSERKIVLQAIGVAGRFPKPRRKMVHKHSQHPVGVKIFPSDAPNPPQKVHTLV